MSGYEWIPSALSLSRIPLGFTVAICALENQWKLAFAFGAVGLLTDWLDGFLADRLGAKSDLGGKLFDPLGDFALTAGMLAGLVFTKTVPWSVVWLAVAILAAIWAPIVLGKGGYRLRLVCEGLAPLYYLAAVLGFIIIYMFRAFGAGAWWWLAASTPLAIITIRIKRYRLAAWFKLLKSK